MCSFHDFYVILERLSVNRPAKRRKHSKKC